MLPPGAYSSSSFRSGVTLDVKSETEVGVDASRTPACRLTMEMEPDSLAVMAAQMSASFSLFVIVTRVGIVWVDSMVAT